MRIQHNIMAMGAYRNYTNNLSAMKKNLEKLSSGYKINRAGDDAAGLAISEKMRAQITGLETAQKNAKDGISLVQTAEGALTEVHDMLNRMVELATQSANGTYDNETDRLQLQKEVNQLTDEINRIADSANFNGIKLLDGSMDSSADLTTKLDFTVGKGLPGIGDRLGIDTVLHKAAANGTKGSEFSLDLYDYEFNNQKGDTMSITMGDTKIEITALEDHTKIENGATVKDTLKGEDLVAKILGGTTTATAGNKYTVKVNGQIYNQGDNITINGQDFSLADAGDGRLTFTQLTAPKTAEEEINPSMNVTVGGKVVAAKAQYKFTPSGTMADGDKVMLGDEELTYDNDWVTTLNQSTKYKAELDGTDVKLTAKAGGVQKDAPSVSYLNAATNSTVAALHVADATDNGKAGIFKFDVDAGEGIKIGGTNIAANYNQSAGATATVVTINGIKYEVTGNLTANTTGTNTLTLTEVASDSTTGHTGSGAIYTGGAANIENDDGETFTVQQAGVAAVKQSWQADISDANWKDGKFTFFTQDVAWDGVSAATSIQAAIDNGTLKHDDFDLSVSADGTKLVMTAKKAGVAANAGYTVPATGTDITLQKGGNFTVKTISKGADAVENPNGDYNVATTVISKVTAADAHRIASTYFDLTKDMVTEGSVLTIGDQKFTFTSNEDMLGQDGYVDISSGDLDKISENLTKAAEKNHVWTVGHSGGGRITLRETAAHDGDYKIDTAKGTVKAPSDGWDLRTAEGIASSLSFVSGTPKTGTALTLQIGDTAESFNQLKVDIKDMHASSLGIGDIDISTQSGAAEAVDKIKAAINSVSDVRGTLGATQNRLDHTINNLSVMTENIQDAESTIRDTDVAAEMMAYTKNNILIQSAQAMLAQANQVPQGVLQLLQ